MALQAVDSEQLTIDDTSGGIGFTEAKSWTNKRTIRAKCTLSTAEVRYNTNSANPPTAGGTEGSPPLGIGTVFTVTGYDDLKNFRAIRTGSTSGILDVIFEGTPA